MARHYDAPMPLLALAQQAATASDDASGRLSMVIIALVVLAVLITVATVVFWRLTRPEPEPAMRWSAAADATSSDDPARAVAPAAPATGGDVAAPGPRAEQSGSAD